MREETNLSIESLTCKQSCVLSGYVHPDTNGIKLYLAVGFFSLSLCFQYYAINAELHLCLVAI